MPNNPQVTITIVNGAIQVSSNSVSISKGGNDPNLGTQVIWQNNTGGAATVSFVVAGSATKTASPFSSNSFDIQNNASQPSGRVSSNATAGGQSYPYSITAGSLTLDPDVIVEN